jgi:hypothetical protein
MQHVQYSNIGKTRASIVLVSALVLILGQFDLKTDQVVVFSLAIAVDKASIISTLQVILIFLTVVYGVQALPAISNWYLRYRVKRDARIDRKERDAISKVDVGGYEDGECDDYHLEPYHHHHFYMVAKRRKQRSNVLWARTMLKGIEQVAVREALPLLLLLLALTFPNALEVASTYLEFT